MDSYPASHTAEQAHEPVLIIRCSRLVPYAWAFALLLAALMPVSVLLGNAWALLALIVLWLLNAFGLRPDRIELRADRLTYFSPLGIFAFPWADLQEAEIDGGGWYYLLQGNGRRIMTPGPVFWSRADRAEGRASLERRLAAVPRFDFAQQADFALFRNTRVNRVTGELPKVDDPSRSALPGPRRWHSAAELQAAAAGVAVQTGPGVQLPYRLTHREDRAIPQTLLALLALAAGTLFWFGHGVWAALLVPIAAILFELFYSAETVFDQETIRHHSQAGDFALAWRDVEAIRLDTFGASARFEHGERRLVIPGPGTWRPAEAQRVLAILVEQIRERGILVEETAELFAEQSGTERVAHSQPGVLARTQQIWGAILVAMFGIWLLGAVASSYRETTRLIAEQATWASTTAIVEQTAVETERSGWRYAPRVFYRYEVGGTQYTSETYRSLPAWLASYEEARQLIAPYSPGQQITVSYNPREPAEAVVAPSESRGALLLLQLAAAVGAIATGAFLGHRTFRERADVIEREALA
jgi:hypothetical protein